jgi:hypothetical protein
VSNDNLQKYNPYHDRLGRFTSAKNAVAGKHYRVSTTRTKKPIYVRVRSVDADGSLRVEQPTLGGNGARYRIPAKDITGIARTVSPRTLAVAGAVTGAAIAGGPSAARAWRGRDTWGKQGREDAKHYEHVERIKDQMKVVDYMAERWGTITAEDNAFLSENGMMWKSLAFLVDNSGKLGFSKAAIREGFQKHKPGGFEHDQDRHGYRADAGKGSARSGRVTAKGNPILPTHTNVELKDGSRGRIMGHGAKGEWHYYNVRVLGTNTHRLAREDEVRNADSMVELHPVKKYNPYHDRLGRFTSASGAAITIRNAANPQGGTMFDKQPTLFGARPEIETFGGAQQNDTTADDVPPQQGSYRSPRVKPTPTIAGKFAYDPQATARVPGKLSFTTKIKDGTEIEAGKTYDFTTSGMKGQIRGRFLGLPGGRPMPKKGTAKTYDLGPDGKWRPAKRRWKR